MKKMLIVMCLIGLFASSASAYPGPDSMGIYMDTEATGLVAVCTDVGQFASQDLYLLISNPTEGQVAAWEAKVEIVTTALYFGSWAVLGNGLNVGSGDEYQVGLGLTPIQPNSVGNLVLMHLPLTVGDTSSPIEIFVKRVPDSASFATGPGYAYEVGFGIECQTSTGGPNFPVFTVNGECEVSDEVQTWGSVKSLYN